VTRPTRVFVALSGILAALFAWGLAGWAAVNGPNYDSWSHAFAAFLLVVLVADAIALIVKPRLNPVRIAVATVGVVITAISAFVTIHWFGDGHPSTWIASVLAWIGFASLCVSAAALSLPARSHGGSKRAT
jgi:hypothetical protein